MKYIKSSNIYQRIKVYRYKLYRKLTSLLRPLGPQKEIAIDFITKLPIARYNRSVINTILVAVKRYTKKAKYISYRKNITIKELVELFIKEI